MDANRKNDTRLITKTIDGPPKLSPKKRCGDKVSRICPGFGP
jgi:hypothetical protein